jgi:hypothetical protein
MPLKVGLDIKKSITFLLLFLIINHSDAQSGIFFQAIARDNKSNYAKERKIYLQISILQYAKTGPKILIEEHQTNTDAFGVFSIMIGNGLRIGGSATSLLSIDWSKGPYYLNLKMAIIPKDVGSFWNYTKEWIDLGTTIFGSVPYALYAANAANMDEKLNKIDTAKMLSNYARYNYIDSLLSTKFSLSDTISYPKKTYTDSVIGTKFNSSDTIYYTKKSFTDSVISIKLNIADTINYTKKSFTDSIISLKFNISDTIYYTKKSFTDSVLNTKFDVTDTIRYSKRMYIDSALLTKLSLTGSAANLTNFPTLNQNTTGNAATATIASNAGVANYAIIAGNISSTSNTTLTALQNLNTVGTIENGIWNGNSIDIAHGGTGLTKGGATGQVLATAADGTFTWTSLTTQTVTHSIGESFGGGIVFYVWDNGRHGLIAATSNLSFGGTSFFTWGPTANYVMAIRNGINAGMYNTERIIIKQGAGIGNYAALIAAHYQFNGNGWGGYGDWYLPSLYELQLLFKQKNVVGGFTNTTYVWSSTEADDKTAYTINFFSGGTVQAEPKNLIPRSVRAIRSF